MPLCFCSWENTEISLTHSCQTGPHSQCIRTYQTLKHLQEHDPMAEDKLSFKLIMSGYLGSLSNEGSMCNTVVY